MTRRNPATSAPATVKRPGRPPAAGTRRQVHTGITLPPEYLDWLKKRGNVSKQIRVMIEQAMSGDTFPDKPNSRLWRG